MTKNITTAEAARLLGVSSERVIQMCKSGILAGAKKPGRDWVIPALAIAGAKKRNTKRGPVAAKGK